VNFDLNGLVLIEGNLKNEKKTGLVKFLKTENMGEVISPFKS
jgi:hypothetical protein